MLSVAGVASQEGELVPFLESVGTIAFLFVLAVGLIWEIRNGG